MRQTGALGTGTPIKPVAGGRDRKVEHGETPTREAVKNRLPPWLRLEEGDGHLPGEKATAVYCFVCGARSPDAGPHMVCGSRRQCGSCLYWRPPEGKGNYGACRQRGLRRHGNQHHCLQWTSHTIAAEMPSDY